MNIFIVFEIISQCFLDRIIKLIIYSVFSRYEKYHTISRYEKICCVILIIRALEY